MPFNEAGADAPEIPSRQKPKADVAKPFNEAGADAPEIPIPLGALDAITDDLQ